MNRFFFINFILIVSYVQANSQYSLLIANSDPSGLLNVKIQQALESIRGYENNFLFNEIKFVNEVGFVNDFSNLLIQHIEKTSGDRFLEYQINSTEAIEEFKRFALFDYILFVRRAPTQNKNIDDLQFWVYDCKDLIKLKEEEGKIVFEAKQTKSAINTSSILYDIERYGTTEFKNAFESLFFNLNNNYEIKYINQPLKIIGNQLFLDKKTGIDIIIQSTNLVEDFVTWKLYLDNGKIINVPGKKITLRDNKVYKILWNYKKDTASISTTIIRWIDVMSFSNISKKYTYRSKRGLLQKKEKIIFNLPINISKHEQLAKFEITTIGDVKFDSPDKITNEILQKHKMSFITEWDGQHHSDQRIMFKIYDKFGIKHDSIMISTPIYNYSPFELSFGFGNNLITNNLLEGDSSLGSLNFNIGIRYFLYDFWYLGGNIFIDGKNSDINHLIKSNQGTNLVTIWSSFWNLQTGLATSEEKGFSANIYYGLNKSNLLTKFDNIAFLSYNTKWNHKIGIRLSQRLKFFYGNGMSIWVSGEKNFVDFKKTITTIKIQQGLIKDVQSTLPYTILFGVSFDF